MSTAIYPALRGQTWPVEKWPLFNTKIKQTWSGREQRMQCWAYPIWKWKIAYDYLPLTDMRTLCAFWLARGGPFDEFLFRDQDDNSTTGQQLGTGDANNKVFPFIRAIGSYLEPIGAIDTTATAPKIYVDGILKATPADYSLIGLSGYAGQNAVQFVTAPGIGAVVTADFSYLYRARFLADDNGSNNFSQFANQIWELQEVDLIGFKP